MLPTQSQAYTESRTKRGSKLLENFVISKGFTILRLNDYSFMYRGLGDVCETLLDMKYTFPVAYYNGWADVISSKT